MRKATPLMRLFLILLLMMQGVAVASSPRSPAAQPMTATAMARCHGSMSDMAASKAAHPSGEAACCAVDCPDMANCALSAAALPSGARLVLPRSGTVDIAADVRFHPPAPPGYLLKPPISSPV